MAIIRKQEFNNYTLMSIYHLRDNDLSLEGKGLLSLLLSLPDNSDFSIEKVREFCNESGNDICKIILELERKGYIECEVYKTNNSDKCEWIYSIYENNSRIKN